MLTWYKISEGFLTWRRVKMLTGQTVASHLEGHLATGQHEMVCDYSSRTPWPGQSWIISHSLEKSWAAVERWEATGRGQERRGASQPRELGNEGMGHGQHPHGELWFWCPEGLFPLPIWRSKGPSSLRSLEVPLWALHKDLELRIFFILSSWVSTTQYWLSLLRNKALFLKRLPPKDSLLWSCHGDMWRSWCKGQTIVIVLWIAGGVLQSLGKSPHSLITWKRDSPMSIKLSLDRKVCELWLYVWNKNMLNSLVLTKPQYEFAS
jgi:hypothetical protein